jgi:hypothetical protein
MLERPSRFPPGARLRTRAGSVAAGGRAAQDLCPMSRFDAIVAELRREFRTFRLVPKDESRLMRALYRALFMRLWCPDFMTHYTTVIVSVVYMPRDLIGTDAGYRTLRHERVHMRDCWRLGVLPFVLSYVALLPAGLTLRSVWEMRGYAETMRAELELEGAITDELLAHIERQFTSPAYFFMCPFPGLVARWVRHTRDRVMAGG